MPSPESKKSYFQEARSRFLSGESTPREFLESKLDVIEAMEPAVQAFASMDLEAARARADESTRRYRSGSPLSPLDGMPIGVKDIIATASLPTEMNSPLYKGHRPAADAAAVMALRRAGCILVGKTATTELAIGSAAKTANPWNPGHTPGGSSSGAAAAVAADMLAASLGTQTQGSIIRPASYCGVFGFKPTWGRLAMEGIHPVAPSHDHLGVISDGADTSWALAQWVGGHAPVPLTRMRHGLGPEKLRGARPRRLALLRNAAFAELDAGSAQAFDGLLERLRRSGVSIVPPEEDETLGELARALEPTASVSTTIVAYEMQAPYGSYAHLAPDLIGQRIHDWLEKSSAVTLPDYVDALEARDGMARRIEEAAASYDAFILPSSSGPAPLGLEHTGSRTLQVCASLLGLPACSVPLLSVDGLPMGCQLVGRRNADYSLMCMAKWLEDEFR